MEPDPGLRYHADVAYGDRANMVTDALSNESRKCCDARPLGKAPARRWDPDQSDQQRATWPPKLGHILGGPLGNPNTHPIPGPGHDRRNMPWW